MNSYVQTRPRGLWLLPFLALLVASCDFDLTSPFAGFDAAGARLTGSFTSEGTSTRGQTAAPQATFEGLTVEVKQDGSIADVAANGTFTLNDLPPGSITLIFRFELEIIGEIELINVEPGQEIHIVLMLTIHGEVILIFEDRGGDGGLACPRGAGFWCQNQDRPNPNLTNEEFLGFAGAAAEDVLASQVEALDSAEKIAEAVCDTSDQLLRHLATLALNLAAGLVDENTPLVGEEGLDTVGDALAKAVELITDPMSSTTDRTEIKDVLEGINENKNTELPGCSDPEPPDTDPPEPDPPDPDPPTDPPTDPPEPDPPDDDVCEVEPDGKITICHFPPGNPGNAHTLRVSPSAWPAHQRHGDTCGACETTNPLR